MKADDRNDRRLRAGTKALSGRLRAGLQIAKTGPRPARGRSAGPPRAGSGGASGPDAARLRAQDRVIKAGGKLFDPEKFKRELHPFDGYEKLKEQAAKNEAPKPPDNFRWRFFGLFYCAPTQKSYMCRLRIPNGILTHWQFAGLADLAERYAGGYAHVTTRANLQMREIEPKNAVAMVEAIQDLGLCSRGSGADNIRNVTGTPTAGIDPQELHRHAALCARMAFPHPQRPLALRHPAQVQCRLRRRRLIPVLEDTNDIGFQAVEVKDGFGVEPGVWFRLALGGITGHKDFARDTGVIVKPEEATMVADAIVRVFIDNGDRTNRAKARLKYVLDAWGFEKFLAAIEDKLGRKLPRCRPKPSRRGRARPPGPYRRACAEAGRPLLDRRRAAGRQAHARRRCAGSPRSPRIRRRRYPPHGLAESFDLRRCRRRSRRRGRDRGARA